MIKVLNKYRTLLNMWIHTLIHVTLYRICGLILKQTINTYNLCFEFEVLRQISFLSKNKYIK
jgi:hypothetical protein